VVLYDKYNKMKEKKPHYTRYNSKTKY